VQIKLKSDKIIDKDTTVQELITILLKNRQIPKEAVREFIYPSYPEIKLNHLQKAVTRIQKAIKNKENILIYGDYDVDGLTATAILWNVLNKLGAKVTPFIPHRHHDGYGFKSESFFRFQKEKNLKFDLIITVDNGIVADKEFKDISKSAFGGKCDIIITDHHLPKEKLPKVYTIIHSTKYSGSAISWVLAHALDKDADLGLAALGTVADCLPLTGINRNIVVHGLKKMNTDPSLGIRQLLAISGNKKEILTTYDLGFVLGPRLNAAGRMDNPTDGLRLLCSTSKAMADKYASILDKHNTTRRDFEKEGILKAEKLRHPEASIIVIADNSFLPGIIGLIAGRLTEKYHLPSIIIAQDKEISKASCRSISQVNIVEVLRHFSDLLLDLGGHAGAAGFSILTKNIPIFTKKLEKYLTQKFDKITEIDAEMSLSAVNMRNINAISKLEPFGIGNPKPIFLLKNIKINSFRTVGSTKDHLQLKLANNLSAIAFKQGKMEKYLKIGQSIDILASLDINVWQNTSSPQLIIKEILL